MSDDGPAELSETDVFALLSQKRRRWILQILRDFPLPLRVRELAEVLGMCEYEDPTDEHVRVIHISLHHVHLPKLADADVVAYDRGDGTVARGPNFGAMVEYRERIAETDSFVAST